MQYEVVKEGFMQQEGAYCALTVAKQLVLLATRVTHEMLDAACQLNKRRFKF